MLVLGCIVLFVTLCQAQLRTNWGTDWQRRLLIQNPPRISQRQSSLQPNPDIPPANLCPANYDGFVAAPGGNCTRFVKCGIPGHGSAYFNCPDGTLYSQDFRSCIQSDLVDCLNGVGSPRSGIINTSWQTQLVNNQQTTNINTNQNRNNRLLTGSNRNNGLLTGLNRNNAVNTGWNRNNRVNTGLNGSNTRLNRNNRVNNALNNANRNTVNNNRRITVELPLFSNSRQILGTAECNTIQNRLNSALPEMVRSYSDSCKDVACLNNLPTFRVRCSQLTRSTNLFTG
ncbi:hypothetical protein LOTGIDRAFT_153798 [Lottia gigantea]|uniref:Chitin-binding type-2 domain-containing protein n=1 Tax=Lottia gigantea TaxID=225164 RepID=V4A3W8_LOTGI|nr:hypothetical protein LOTGIDRAFT_153798 [Lottia gigantea]ESO91362.1 hypothetical protein LOTGIDRAFT_153798 [Lottia gigantea]